MSIRIPICFLLCLFLSTIVKAQPAVTWGSALAGNVTSMAIDHAGNIYTTGYYIGTVDFDPGPGVHTLSMPTALNKTGYYLLKRSANNAFIQVADLSYNVETMHVDLAGNVLLGGKFRDATDFDPGSGTHIMVPQSDHEDFFVVKLNHQFDFQWAYTGGDQRYNGTVDIDADKAGNVFVMGYFEGTVDFDPGPAVSSFSTFDTSQEASFVLKLTKDGALAWATALNDAGISYPTKLALDNESNVYTSGEFGGRLDFDPGPDTAWLLSGKYITNYLYKLDSNGGFGWVRQMPAYYAVAQDMAFDKDQNLVVTGPFLDWMSYNKTDTLTVPVQYDYGSFLLKINRDGDGMWLVNTGARSPFLIPALLTIDTLDNMYITGEVWDSCDFDPGPGTYMIYAIRDSGNGFGGDLAIASYSPDGSLAWANSYTSYETARAKALAFDKWNNMVLSVNSYDTLDAELGPGTYNIYADDSFRIGGAFVIKYGLCPGAISRSTINACDSFVFNGYTRKKNGTYYQRIATSGCDSTAIIDLNLTTPDAAVIINKGYLEAQSLSGTYEWIDCNNGMKPVAGANKRVFFPAFTGSYALRITDNGCTASSACYAMVGTGIDDKQALPSLSCYPNPTTGRVSIDFGSEQELVMMELTDVSGRILNSATIGNSARASLTIEGPAGLYFLRLATSGDEVKVIKVVKQ